VPKGFVVTTAAYRAFVEQAGLAALVSGVTADLDAEDPAAVNDASATLRAAFEAEQVPGPVAEKIATALLALGGAPVAVRSSATAEDLPQASFAGQQDTFLDVRGIDAVVAAVQGCWSSLWSARALAYRGRQGIDHAQVGAAVVVQEMVPADVSGVLFTANPMTGVRHHLVIEAVKGRGDALVGGRATPQRWVMDSRTGSVLTAPDTNHRLVTSTTLRSLNKIAVLLARMTDDPQDIEWATVDEVIWILQARPVTTLFPVPIPGPSKQGLRVYMPLNLVAQGMTEPLTPAGCAFFVALVDESSAYWSLRSRRGAQSRWVAVVLGRMFYDITPLLSSRGMADSLPARMQLKDPAAGAALREWLDHNADRLQRTRDVALPLGMSVWALRQVPGFIAAVAAPLRAGRRLVQKADRELAELQTEASKLTAPEQLLEFTFERLPRRAADLVVAQLPPVYVGLVAAPLAEWLCARWLGSSAGVEPIRRWLPRDPTVAMGAEIAELARDYAAAGVTPSGAEPGIARFLSRYGHRAPDREIDLGLPRFDDDATYVVELVRGCMSTEDPGALLDRQREGLKQAATALERLVAAVHDRKGPPRARLLRMVLMRMRELGGLRERPKFDLIRVLALGRESLRQVGLHLVAEHRLASSEDVFFLDPSDLRAGLSRHTLDLSQRANQNRRQYERELRRRAVPRVLTSEGEALFGPTPSGEEPADGLLGTGVSPGTHEGVVRVLESPVGAELRSGEVLVAATTDPGWTPLFLLAGALVMEVGGVISHGAIVAREYGIPAVANVPDATRLLRTGQRVRVDGSAGRVTILDGSA
jgi:pyruvate,water dikinase